jgi:hypothetical protein
MLIGLLLVLIAALIAAVYGVFRLSSWRSAPAELRGDWWERFERQFRAYARAVRLEQEGLGQDRRHHPR